MNPILSSSPIASTLASSYPSLYAFACLALLICLPANNNPAGPRAASPPKATPAAPKAAPPKTPAPKPPTAPKLTSPVSSSRRAPCCIPSDRSSSFLDRYLNADLHALGCLL